MNPDRSEPSSAMNPRRLETLRNHIRAWTSAHAKEQADFLVRLCEQNSFTSHKPGTDRVAALILEQLGGRLPFRRVIQNSDAGDLHILANRPAGKTLYLLGHMDTVFPPGFPFQSCRKEGVKLRGPGTADMKGGLVVTIFALAALENAGLLDSIPIRWILSGDEETGSPASREIYLAERENALACFVMECGGKGGSVVLSRNGKMGLRIDVSGRDRHVGAGSSTKSSAILELAHKITSLESLNASLPGASLNVGRIEGGLGPATVPAQASALVDVRWVEEGHRSELLSDIERIVGEVRQPGCRAEYTILNSRPAMPATAASEALFKTVKKAAASLGFRIKREHRRGTSDANFFGTAGIPTLDGLGPIGDRDHTPDEHIDLPSLERRTALLALVLAGFAGAGKLKA